MRKVWRKVWTLLSVQYALMVEYRGELFLWLVATALPLVMMGLWVQAGATGRFPLNDVDMARYFLAAFLIRQMTMVWVIYDFEWQVVSGRLSPLLLQPIDPSWRFVTAHLAEQGARLPLTALLIGLIVALYPRAIFGEGMAGQSWSPPLWAIPTAVVATYAAFALRYITQYTLAMLAFWLERVAKLEPLWFLPYLFLSGLIAPIEVFPEPIKSIAMWTPFPYMLWFPAKLLVDGDVPVVKGFAVIGFWLLVSYAFSRWLWRRGLKHYSAMGA